MEFNKNFNEILNSVEELFNKIELPTVKIYRGDSNWNKLYDYFEEQTCHFLNSGLTKFVLDLDNKNNFIIKIPFAGTCYRGIDKESYCVNHCERELEYYNDFKNTEIGFLLVPTYFVGKVGELEIYIQPKVVPYSHSEHSASQHSYQIAADMEYYSCTADDDDAIAAFVENFNDEAEHILCKLDEFGIRDIHCGNFGYLNGKLLIFDYCGYHSQCTDYSYRS